MHNHSSEYEGFLMGMIIGGVIIMIMALAGAFNV